MALLKLLMKLLTLYFNLPYLWVQSCPWQKPDGNSPLFSSLSMFPNVPDCSIYYSCSEFSLKHPSQRTCAPLSTTKNPTVQISTINKLKRWELSYKHYIMVTDWLIVDEHSKADTCISFTLGQECFIKQNLLFISQYNPLTVLDIL